MKRIAKIVRVSHIDSSGMSIAHAGDESSTGIEFKNIFRITVFKRDLFSYDLVCLSLKTTEDGFEYEIDEEDPLWDAFLDNAEKHLSSMIPKGVWYPKVADPAFAPNPMLIYTA